MKLPEDEMIKTRKLLLKEYIKQNYIEENTEPQSCSQSDASHEEYLLPLLLHPLRAPEIDGFKVKEESFSEMLLRLIDESGLSDVECYKLANVDRKLFSKIRSNKGYQPSRKTALVFALVLHLSIEETNRLLGAAGFKLSHSLISDVIVEFFIEQGCYDLEQINEALAEYGEKTL